jgi:DNA-binding transcriptional MocR family regulator
LSAEHQRVIIGTIVAEPIRSSLAGIRIGAPALADLLGRWPAGDGALYRLLALRIARLADTGELSPGLRLPPERELAVALSVSRNTVAAAYQLLRDEGMAESRQGAGTRITPHRTTPAAVHRANGFFSGMLESTTMAADLTASIVDCAPQVATALTDPASVAGPGDMRAVLQTSGYFPHGLPVLREVIADHLTRRLGLPSTPEQVMVTTGSQQALDLVIRAEVLPGQPVAVEDPTFPGVLDTLHRCGASVIGIAADGGADPARVAHVLRTHRPALVYLIPTHHNPTGLVMPAGQRQRITALAAANPETVFVDDMTLAELPLRDGAPPPPLAAYADRGAGDNLVTVGSLSKIYWGGLRIGWIRASSGLVGRLAAAKAAADLGSPAFWQLIAAGMLADRHDEILKWRGEWLRPRYEALTQALGTRLPQWSWPVPDGGPTLWVRLPRCDPGTPADGGAFAQAALRRGIAVVPGRLLSASDRDGASEHIRLAFTQPPEVLVRAVDTLAGLLSGHPGGGDETAGAQHGRPGAVVGHEQLLAGQVQQPPLSSGQAGVVAAEIPDRDLTHHRAGWGYLLQQGRRDLAGAAGGARAAQLVHEQVTARQVHPLPVVGVIAGRLDKAEARCHRGRRHVKLRARQVHCQQTPRLGSRGRASRHQERLAVR